MPLVLENPIALLLLLLLPAIYLLGWERLSLMARWRGRAILGIRAAAVAAVVLALAGPSMPLKDATMSVAFLLDSSSSVSPATRAQQDEWVRQAIGGMRSTDRAAVIRFAGEAVVTKPLGGEKEYRPAPTGDLKDGTNLSAALQLASGLLPASGLRRIVVLSDGWDTAGKVEETARSLPAGTRVDVVQSPALEGLPEVLIESVEVPSYLREGDGFDVSAVVGSDRETTARIRVLVDGQQSGEWDVQLGKGANLVTMSQKPLPQGFHSVDLLLSTEEDTVEENNRAAGGVTVKQRGRVLLVEGAAVGSDSLRRELEESGLEVSEIGAGDFPSQLPLLMGFDAVVLNDVPGPSFSLDQLKTLQAYVRDQGRGLLTVGGRASYGLGDYVGGLLEEILPVSSEAPISRDRGDMALVLVVDRSGSMDDALEGVTKIDMAREAAIQATSVLKPEDQVAVIAFDTDPAWIVPPQKVGNNLEDIRNRISSLQSNGGTDIYTALQAAFYTAQGMQATTKHITLLTDGQSWKGPYQTLLQRIKASRITLSTIGIGGDADRDWLSELAGLGDGRAYFTEQFSDVPRIVYREVSAATKVAEVNGQVDPRFSSPSPVLRGMSKEDMPPLTGYVATKPKDAATVVLESERGDPLLSQWQYGLGRVVAWTSDAGGMWAAQWLSQPTFRRVWDQAVRWSMAPPIDRNLQVTVRTEGQETILTVDSVDLDGRYVSLTDTRADVWDPEGRQQSVALRQTAPGRYQATISAATPGVYRVEVHQARDGQVTISETAGFAVPWAPEFPGLGSNDTLLKELAAMTGGRSIRDPRDAFSRTGMPSSPGWEPLWPHLLATALLLLPVEVALRRIRSLPFGRRSEEEPEQPPAQAAPAVDPDREKAAA